MRRNIMNCRLKGILILGIFIILNINLIISSTYSDCNIYGNCKPVTTTSQVNYSLIPTVNSSDYWDDLDTPADILGSLINNDLGWINASASGDNSSWNESYANTLYADISVTGDNSSWSESHANSLYYSIDNPNNYLNTSTGDSWAGNYTFYYNKSEIDNNLSLYYLDSNPDAYINVTSISNSTIARTGDCSAGQVVMNITTSGVECTTPTAVETEPSWNGNYSIFLGLIDNASYLSTFNSTYDLLGLSNDGTKTTILTTVGDYLRIGDASLPTASEISSEDDLYVSGDFEVANTANFFGTMKIRSTTGADAIFFLVSTTTQGGMSFIADDGIHLYPIDTDGRANNNIIITEYDNRNKDHDHFTVSPNPTLFIHSNTNPDTNNTQWISLTHDTTDGVIDTGTGNVKIADNLNITGNLEVGGCIKYNCSNGCITLGSCI